MNFVEEIISFANSALEEILDDSGQYLYSGASTLRPGAVYLLGHNPGGSPAGREDESIRRSLNELPDKKTNNYIDDSWVNRPAGQSPLQVRVCWLLENIGFDPREVCASNLIFSRSVDAANINFEKFANICWPVHEKILNVVSPSLIIAFGNSGNSPYSYLKNKLGNNGETTHASGHGNWKCKTFLSDSGTVVVGLPHLSRYAVDHHPHVPEWINEICPLPSHSSRPPKTSVG